MIICYGKTERFMKSLTNKSKLKRAINTMPRNIQSRLVNSGLLEKYKERPAYQQNDYLGWIFQAKLESTRERRVLQMLDELKRGDSYMKMKWNPR